MDSIRIDGKLDEFTWAVAPRAGRFHNIRNLAQGDTAPTEAAMVWDDTRLYISFACGDSEAWGTMKDRDDRLWNEEVVEVFLDPDGDGRNYAELEVSPNNVVVDLMIAAPRTGAVEEALRWDIEGLETAVARHGAGWAVEIAIPWASLGRSGVTQAPRAGDRWRVGLYRIERPGGVSRSEKIAALRAALAKAAPEGKSEIERQISELEADLQYLAWSPTRAERGFHDPERFGVVEFAGGHEREAAKKKSGDSQPRSRCCVDCRRVRSGACDSPRSCHRFRTNYPCTSTCT
jgi:hypothetical protein